MPIDLPCVCRQVINGLDNSTSRDRVYAFSYTSLMDIMRDFSSISVTRIVIGFVLMVSVCVLSMLGLVGLVMSACHRCRVYYLSSTPIQRIIHFHNNNNRCGLSPRIA